MNAHRVAAKSKEEFRLIELGIGIGLFLFVLDQWTKLLVERRMVPGESVELIQGLFSLTFVTNQGAAWGIFHGYGMMLFAIGMIVLVLALVFLRQLCDGCRERYLAIFVVLSGVLGNSVDRLWRGAVVDFLDFYWHGHHWPSFNVADCAICIGIGIYIISALLRKERSALTPDGKK